MKRFLTIALVASMGLFMASAANAGLATYLEGAVAGGIGLSRHNLGAFGVHVTTTGTTEICIFCHTPHHSNTSAAPLWNRATRPEGDFQSYNSNGTNDGDTIAGNAAGAGPSSLACLSCHDGVTQFDVLVNAPGQGGVTTAGGGTDQGWTFTMGSTFGNSGNNFMATLGMMGGQSRLNIDDGAPGMGDNAYNVGAGLSNDHPIGIVYYGAEDTATAKASLRNQNTVISGINLTAGINETTATTAAITAAYTNLGSNLWAIGGFIDGPASGAEINMLLRDGKVECSSCHDPHFSNHSWDEYDGALDGEDEEWNEGDDSESDGLFLRRVGGNTGSAICRTCHNK